MPRSASVLRDFLDVSRSNNCVTALIARCLLTGNYLPTEPWRGENEPDALYCRRTGGPQIICDMLHVGNRDVRQPGLTSQWFLGGALEATTPARFRDDIAHKCGLSVSTLSVRKKLEGSSVAEDSLPEIVRVWLASINGKDIVYYSYNNFGYTLCKGYWQTVNIFMFVVREAQLKQLRGRRGARVNFFTLSETGHRLIDCVLGTSAEHDRTLAAWRTSRVQVTIDIIERVLGSWDPDDPFSQTDAETIAGGSNALPVAVPRAMRGFLASVVSDADSKEELDEQVTLACGVPPSSALDDADLDVLGDEFVEEQQAQQAREREIREMELERLKQEVTKLGVMAGMQGVPPLIGDLNSLEMVDAVNKYIRLLRLRLTQAGKASPGVPLMSASDGSPSYAKLTQGWDGIHSSGVLHHGKEFAIKFSETVEIVLRMAISGARPTTGQQDFFFYGGDPTQGQVERLEVLFASDADGARRCRAHLVGKGLLRETGVVTAKQVLAYKCLRMVECPSAYLWGVVDWGVELEQLLLQAEDDIDNKLAMLVENYMAMFYATRNAYKYVSIIQCYEIDWHLASPQLRAAMDTFLFAREARNGRGQGNDRVVEWSQRYLRVMTGNKKTVGTESALRQSVINLPELLRIRADQRGKQSARSEVSADSRSEDGLPPELCVAVSDVTRVLLKYFRETRVWALGENIVVLGQTQQGSAPKKRAVKSAAVATADSIGRLITPCENLLSPLMFTMFDEAKLRLARSAALLGVRSHYSPPPIRSSSSSSSSRSSSSSSSSSSSVAGSSSALAGGLLRKDAVKQMKTLFPSISIAGKEIKQNYEQTVLRATSTNALALSKPGFFTADAILKELENDWAYDKMEQARKLKKPQLLDLIVQIRKAKFDAQPGLQNLRVPSAPAGLDKSATCAGMFVRLPSFLQYGIEKPSEALYGTGAGSALETAEQGMPQAEAGTRASDEDEEAGVESPLAKKVENSDDDETIASKRTRH